MLASITLLLVYQTIGEVLVHTLNLPIPGPVVGMLMLFITLVVRKSVSEELRDTSQGLLQHLSLLFVPAGVGVMAHFTRILDEWLPLLVALLVSTVLTIGITALTMGGLLKLSDKRRESKS
ncbi:MAG: CidA/LrgA family protein [Burkholderiales bacterium]